MIVTDLEHSNNQLAISPLIRKALDFLRRPDLCDLPDGEMEIEGRRAFAIVQRYGTVIMPVPKFEFHRKHIDIQYMVSGAEVIGWAPAGRVEISEAYSADGDICFGTVGKGEWTPVYLAAGQLTVLYPEDAHAPRIAAGAAASVMKVVVKIRV